MDKDVVGAKLETLRRCVQRIKDKTPDSAKFLADDYDLQDIICLNLELQSRYASIWRPT